MKKTLLLSLLAIGFAGVVSAQVTVNVSATVKMLVPLTVTKTSDLDFGTLSTGTIVGPFGTAFIDPLQLAAPTYNGLVPTGTSAPHAAQILISGSANASISITSSVPSGDANVKLTSPSAAGVGPEIVMTPSFALGSALYTYNTNGGLDQQLSVILDANGNQQITVGGMLATGAGGLYEGVYSIPNAMTFTVNYN